MIQCPNCGGLLKFDIASQQMKCDSCSSQFNPYAFEMSGAEESTEYDVTVFKCPQCGGEITSTDETAAGFCSYCGSSNVLESRLSKEKKPELIIPFKKTKKDCEASFEKFIKKAIFAPKSYREAGKADSFRGIYMPYWLYDMSQRCDINVPTSTSHRSGDYIITDHYMMRGTLDNYYNGVSYDASSTFSDDISSTIAPYSVKDITKFSPSFLSGFYADLADVGVDIYKGTAVELAQESTYNYLKNSSPMAHTSFDKPKEQLKDTFKTNINVTRSALFPVWFMSYRNRNRVAYATVNGQSGKVYADIPMSVPKFLLCALVIAAILFAVFQMFFTIVPKVLIFIVAILGLISVLIYGSGIKKLAIKGNHDDDLGMQDRERRIREKNKARLQAQKGAAFSDSIGNDGAYVLTQNDIKRNKREQARKQAANKKSSGSLVSIIFVIMICIVGGVVFSDAIESVFDSGNIGLIGGVVSLMFVIISVISLINASRNISDIKGITGPPASLWSLVSLVIIMVVCFWSPIDDNIYYMASIVAMVGIILNIIGIIRGHNLLAMRPLPQFEMYQGGDDRA